MGTVTSHHHDARFAKPANKDASGSEVASLKGVSGHNEQSGLNRKADETFQFQRMFDRSPRVTAQAKLASALANRPVQRMCHNCSEEEETVQTKSATSTTGAVAQRESANRTGLPDSLKSGVEAMSGLSMDDVRVHYNSDKPAQLQAHAYTQGSDIHVAPGHEQHLAHEAWHVVQQKQGRVAPTAQLKGIALNDDDSLEKEADRMGAQAFQMKAEKPGTPPLSFEQSSTTESAPVQRTRNEALEALGTTDPEVLYQYLRDTSIPVGQRRHIAEVNNRDLSPFSGEYINIFALPEQWENRSANIDDDDIEIEKEKSPEIRTPQKRKFVPKEIRESGEKEESNPASPRKRTKRTRKVSREKSREKKKSSSRTGKEKGVDSNQETQPTPLENPFAFQRPSLSSWVYRSDRFGTREYTPETGWQNVSQVGGVTEIEPPSSQIGIATWNVAHFSNVDLQTTLQEFQNQFDNYEGTDWEQLFSDIDSFVEDVQSKLDEFKEQPKIFSYVESEDSEVEVDDEKDSTFEADEPILLPPRPTSSGGRTSRFQPREKPQQKPEFQSDRTLRRNNKELFGGLQDGVDDKLRHLENLIGNIRQATEAIDVEDLSEGINAIAELDWQKEFEEGRDPSKRAAFADKVKKLRKFDIYAEPAGEILESVGAITTRGDLNTLLTRLSGENYEGLLQTLARVKGTLPKVVTIYQLGRALHSFNIKTHVDEMFERNQWLDLLTLQEVNDPELLKDSDQYDLHLGPELLSGGKTPQHEFYPLLTRKDARIIVDKKFVLKTSGDMEEVGDRQPIEWNKRNTDYRPIVVYQIRKGLNTNPVWIGVVHTTPEPDTSGNVAEFNRRNIYGEIEKGLATLRKNADEQGIPLIIGGDYYLTAEAVVKRQPEQDESEDELQQVEFEETRERIKELKHILEYQLDQSLDEEDRSGIEEPTYLHTTPEEVQGQTEKIRQTEGNLDLQTIIRERIKFLKEALRDEQLLRNIEDLTVKKQVNRLGLEITQTISGTNPKKDPLGRWFDLQIADFFIHNKQWESAEVGLLRPEGKLLTVDTEDRDYSRYWQHFSDHFPVGGVFSLNQKNLKEHPAFVQPSGSKEDARRFNIRRFAGLQFDKEYPKHSPRLADAFRKLDGIKESLNKAKDNPQVDEHELEAKRQQYFMFLKKYTEQAQKEEEPRQILKNQKLGSFEADYLALKYLHEQYQLLLESHPLHIWESGLTTLEEYITAIQELEEQQEVDPEDRLLVATSADFEPNYKEG